MSLLLVNANTLHIPLADKSVHMALTSPPYWGLRSYSGTATWVGGDVECDHIKGSANTDSSTLEGGKKTTNHQQESWGDYCHKCGAQRIDAQLGLERVPDCLGWATGESCGECYICHCRQWAAEVWRVLRDDGTFWLNIGDSYAGSGAVAGGEWTQSNTGSGGTWRGGPESTERRHHPPANLKPKDLCLIPQRLALALQADGWYVRSEIIWAKPNPMPESVTDRPTKSHETVWLLAKGQRYFWDADAVRESYPDSTLERLQYPHGKTEHSDNGWVNTKTTTEKVMIAPNPAGRNRRTVWSIATEPYSGAHFATWPRALVEPMIKAGTSEAGCCSMCGKQWERVVEIGYQKAPGGSYGGRVYAANPNEKREGHIGDTALNKTTTTLGFRPSCTCAAPAIPCTVFDPFAGSGTSLLVTRKLGRNAVGTDLSYGYLHDQARARLSLDALDEWTNGKKDGKVLSDLPMFANLE